MAKSKVEVYLDSKALNKILNGTAVQQASMRKASMGLAVAKATAPKKSGRFASGFQVKPATVQGGRKNEDRAGAVIENRTPYAAYVHKTRQANFYKLLRQRMEGRS